MAKKIPGQPVNSPIAVQALRAPGAKVERLEGVLCAADVFMTHAELVMEARPGCECPSPVLYLSGRITSLKGDFPDDVNELVFSAGGAAIDENGHATVDAPVSAAGPRGNWVCIHCGAENQATDPICTNCHSPYGRNETETLMSVTGCAVRFRYEFTPREKAELVAKGLMEPGFGLPQVFINNTFETMPLVCNLFVVHPDNASSLPFIFSDIDHQYCIETSSYACGYTLIDYFKTSETMQKYADKIQPIQEAAYTEQAQIEHLDEDLFDGFHEGIDAELPTLEDDEAQAEARDRLAKSLEDVVPTKTDDFDLEKAASEAEPDDMFDEGDMLDEDALFEAFNADAPTASAISDGFEAGTTAKTAGDVDDTQDDNEDIEDALVDAFAEATADDSTDEATTDTEAELVSDAEADIFEDDDLSDTDSEEKVSDKKRQVEARRRRERELLDEAEKVEERAASPDKSDMDLAE